MGSAGFRFVLGATLMGVQPTPEKSYSRSVLPGFWRTLTFRISVVLVVSWGILLAGSYFGNYQALEQTLTANIHTTIGQTSQLLNTAISAASNQQGGDLRTLEAFFREVVSDAEKNGIVYVVVVKEDGATQLVAGAKALPLPAPDAGDAYESCAVRGLCHIRNSILLFGSEVGFVQYGLATQSSMDALQRVNTASLAIAGAATLLIFLAIALAGIGVARRVARLNRASREIARGNYSIRVKIDGSDELSDLSANFNTMADSIASNIAEISGLTVGLEARVQARTEELNASNRLLAANVAQLESAREQLVKSEKLAGLGALVAGVSHELNTPIGNALVAATTVHQKAKEFAAAVAQNNVSRKDLGNFVNTALEGADLTERSLRRAADLISSFKMVAVDRASERRRVFDLAGTVQDVLTTYYFLRKLHPESIDVAIEEGITMDSFPGPLVQVLSNLIDNALTHAFGPSENGKMVLRAAIERPGHIRIEFSDNGRGISQQHLKRVFDPFFTTKLGHGGSGLGLNIVNNIVEGVLGGSIRLESEIGRGSLFVLDLPCVAPI